MSDRSPATETRRYRMQKRAEDIAVTRRRIVEAAVELHGSVGPTNTTFSAVAERAGVQRSTVYRHFPDEQALFGACTRHWLERHPWPHPDDWADIEDFDERLSRAVGALYGFYDENRQMIANSLRDIDVMPSFVGDLIRTRLHEIVASLVEGRPDGDRRFTAAVAHAVDFRSWSSLTDAGLSTPEAADLITSLLP